MPISTRRMAVGLSIILIVGFLWSGTSYAAPLAQGEIEHVVQSGETLFRIAQTYGVTVDDIVVANDLTDRDIIHVGQRLKIPAAAVEVPSPSGQTAHYVVQVGDTLSLIAQRFATTVEAVAQDNGILNPNLIVVGQTLTIPLSQGAPAPAPQTVVHLVQPGETLARIALRYGTTTWAIAQINDLSNLNVIHVGQQLVIPGLAQSTLIDPFIGLLFEPTVAVQGETVAVHVSTERDVTLSGSFDGRPVRFFGDSGTYWALVGIRALITPGLYPLELTAADAGGNVRITQMLQVTAGSYPTDYINLPPEKGGLLDPALLALEREKLAAVFGNYRPEKLWDGLFRFPVEAPRVTSPFGSRRSYNGGPVASYHAGTDFGGDEGMPIYAPAAGVVALAEPLTVRGNAVVVDHGLGVFSGYWHLSEIDVEVGQPVVPGSLLGAMGTTGLSTGTHLHWELRVSSIPVDPIQWTEQAFP